MTEHIEKVAIYPGSFDPITNGHIDIIKRASLMFDKVIVAVAQNKNKKPLFSEQERVEMIRDSIVEIPHVSVDSFQGLLVKYAQETGSIAIIRGLRAVSDFEYEFQMALMNRKLAKDIITVFLMPHERYSYLNSSIVKELVMLDGDIDCFVPVHVKEKLLEKMRNQ